MVYSKPSKATGEKYSRNLVSKNLRLVAAMTPYRVTIPAISGIPKYYSHASQPRHGHSVRAITHNEHGYRNIPISDLTSVVRVADHVDEEHGVGAEQCDLQQGVDYDEDRAVLIVSACEVVPDDDHCDTSSDTDHDDAGAISREVGQCRPRKAQHEKWSYNPVQDEGYEQVLP